MNIPVKSGTNVGVDITEKDKCFFNYKVPFSAKIFFYIIFKIPRNSLETEKSESSNEEAVFS